MFCVGMTVLTLVVSAAVVTFDGMVPYLWQLLDALDERPVVVVVGLVVGTLVFPLLLTYVLEPIATALRKGLKRGRPPTY